MPMHFNNAMKSAPHLGILLPLQEEPALLKASKAGDAERVARLLANGHDPTVRDAKGRSPYQLAANKEVRRLLWGPSKN